MGIKGSKVVDRLPTIYGDLKPNLMSKANRYQAPNPKQVVEEWLSRAYMIALGFDDGSLQMKVYSDSGNREDMEIFDPSKHDISQFDDAFKNYLKQAFVRDVLKEYNKNKRHTELNAKNNARTATTSSFSLTGFASIGSLLKYDAITINHVIDLLKHDLTSGSESDVIQQLFVQAILNFCITLRDREGPGDWKNLVVVPNLDEPSNKKFFAYDFRTELEAGICKEICKLVLQESNPLIVQRLSVFTSLDKPAALRKRIFRYFFEKKGGFPIRLKTRVKNNTL